jgi:hypothetical protein
MWSVVFRLNMRKTPAMQASFIFNGTFFLNSLK